MTSSSAEGICAPICFERRDGRGHHVLQDVDRLVAAEEAPAGEALPEDDGHREDVALDGAHAALVDPLGREVRELALHLVRARRLDPVLRLGDAEVGDVGPAVAADEDVVRGDVAMDDVERLAVVVLQLVGGVKARAARRG